MLVLAYRQPFDWDALLSYLRRRAIPGIEAVLWDNRGRYCRTLRLDGCQGHVVVGCGEGSLEVEISPSLLPVKASVHARLRRLFDLDIDLAVVNQHLSSDTTLAPLVLRRPGLRVPGTVDGFELALRAVLGQQVTVAGASTLAGRLAQLVAEPLSDAPPGLSRLPISAERLAQIGPSSIAEIGLPRARAASIIALARAVAAGELSELTASVPNADPAEFERKLAALPGVGAWTASYVAMRALHWRDAFPEGDIGLRKAMGGLSPAQLRAAAERWRPWRAYAAMHLWASLSDYRVQTPRAEPSER